MSIFVSIADQKLYRVDRGKVTFSAQVSTALKGVGQLKGSEQTPLGEHYIRAKIGSDIPLNAVFVSRRFTGEIYTPGLAEAYPERDWILSRIIWLCGCEPGKNRLGSVDSMSRYIYIHGTPDTEPMGIPVSHGCIRMRNKDLVALFNSASAGESVQIFEAPFIVGKIIENSTEVD